MAKSGFPSSSFELSLPEHIVVIFDIIFVEQNVKFLEHEGVVDIQSVPLKALGQGIRLLPQFVQRDVLKNRDNMNKLL